MDVWAIQIFSMFFPFFSCLCAIKLLCPQQTSSKVLKEIEKVYCTNSYIVHKWKKRIKTWKNFDRMYIHPWDLLRAYIKFIVCNKRANRLLLQVISSNRLQSGVYNRSKHIIEDKYIWIN